MPDRRTLSIEGHTLAILPLNPDSTGEPVILVHGVTGNVATWQVNPLPCILEQGPCYALSLPGHYPAEFPPNLKQNQLTAELLAHLMAEAIRQTIGECPATLIGHSTGGFAVLNIAARYPELVRRAVCVAGFAHGHWTGLLGIQQQLVRGGMLGKTLFKSWYKLSKAGQWILKAGMPIFAPDIYAQYSNPDTARALQHTLSNFQRLDLDAMVKYFAVMPDIDISSLLPEIKAQTLVIAGDHDPTVSPDQSRKIASLVPGAELVIISGAGHLSFLERPAGYEIALSNWLKRT